MNKGLRPAYCLYPKLLKLYLNSVIDKWSTFKENFEECGNETHMQETQYLEIDNEKMDLIMNNEVIKSTQNFGVSLVDDGKKRLEYQGCDEPRGASKDRHDDWTIPVSIMFNLRRLQRDPR